MSPHSLSSAYAEGSRLAKEEFHKTAFLGSVFNTGKFLLGMGNLGAKGSGLARISAHHVGMPLGFGIFGAMGSDEGKKTEGFIKGLAGGLAFNAGMHYGGILGKKVLAPGFGGKNYSGVLKRLGYGEGAAESMAAASRLNKPLHGSIERRLGAGTAHAKHIDKLRGAYQDASAKLDFSGNEGLASTSKKLKSLFTNKTLTPEQQKELQNLYSEFSKQLYSAGKATGTAGQQRALTGLRFAKGLGTVVGGMGAGMMASHAAENAFTTHPASPFDARGGH